MEHQMNLNNQEKCPHCDLAINSKRLLEIHLKIEHNHEFYTDMNKKTLGWNECHICQHRGIDLTSHYRHTQNSVLQGRH